MMTSMPLTQTGKGARRKAAFRVIIVLVSTLLIITAGVCRAQTEGQGFPLVSVDYKPSDNPGDMAVVMQIFILLTILSLAPAILIMVTSFTRIAIVLSLLRQALGTHQMPPNQIILGLALFLTFFIMTPVWQQVNSQAVQPFLGKKISQQEAIEKAVRPIRRFMYHQTREKDLALFVNISKLKKPKNIGEVPTSVLIPSFIISELKTAFQIGFLLYVPFLILDMVVASVLLSMGMMMLPPVMISLPFKLMLFVLADGWYLIVGSLVKSFA